MRILIALAVVVTVALIASSSRFWSLRRTRLGAAMLTGGWIMVGIGILLGPHGVALLDAQHITAVEPLIVVLLGWIGLVVGLGADRRLPQRVPPLVMKLAASDVLMSLLLFGVGAYVILRMQEVASAAAWPAALLLGACGAGWSAEVRSLKAGKSGEDAISAVMRASAGVAAIGAVVIYGILFKTSITNDTSAPAEQAVQAASFAVAPIAVGLGASALIALAMGLMGKWLMTLAGRGEAEFLVVLLGLVSFTAGAAATLGYSPLFVALLTGAVVTNLPGKALAKFGRVLLEAEQPAAMALMLVAGLLADPRIGLPGLLLACTLVLIRAIWKLGPLRLQLRSSMNLSQNSPIFAGLVRQSPLAIALAVGYAISHLGLTTESLIDGRKLLCVVIVSGLVAEAWPFLHRFGSGTSAKPQDAESKNERPDQAADSRPDT